MSVFYHRCSANGDCFPVLAQHFCSQNYGPRLRSFEPTHDFRASVLCSSVYPNPICAIILPDQNIHRSDPVGFAVRKMPTAVLVGLCGACAWLALKTCIAN